MSRVASLPEVMGDVAAWFDPEDVEDMAATLLRVIDDEAFRRDLAARGPGQAARFSWDRTASETVAVYRDVAS